MRTRRVVPLAVVALAVGLSSSTLSSCGGDDDPTGADGAADGASVPTTQPATADGLEAAARLHAERLFSDEPGDAYDGLSARCRATLSRADYVGQIEIAAPVFAQLMGFELTEATVGTVVVQDVTATTGEASVEVLAPDGSVASGPDDDLEAFVYEDGAWRNDTCPTTSG